MKLTPEQRKLILQCLINEGLEYKEFIDEINDHFCDSIEAKLNEGLNFAQALGATVKSFENEVYRSSAFDLFPTRGLRALEKAYFKSRKNEARHLFFSEIRKTPFSKINIAIAGVLIAFFLGYQQGVFNKYVLFALLPLTHLVVYHYLNFKSDGKAIRMNTVFWNFMPKPSRVRSIKTDVILHLLSNSYKFLFILPYLIYIVDTRGWIRNWIVISEDFYFSCTLLIYGVMLYVYIPIVRTIYKTNLSS